MLRLDCYIPYQFKLVHLAFFFQISSSDSEIMPIYTSLGSNLSERYVHSISNSRICHSKLRMNVIVAMSKITDVPMAPSTFNGILLHPITSFYKFQVIS